MLHHPSRLRTLAIGLGMLSVNGIIRVTASITSPLSQQRVFVRIATDE